jgi:hypothetical protein
VWYSPKEGVFKFQLWYVSGGAKPGSIVDSFEGPVILVGDVIMFAGVSRDRARSVFWTYDSNDEVQGHFEYCRFGMTSSAKARDDRAPVAACTVCLKLEGEEEHWQWWCSQNSKVIGVDSFKNIIDEDFGDEILKTSQNPQKTFSEWVGLFIENKPMSAAETGYAAEDRILRLNLNRFRIRMDDIRKLIIAENKPAPFNGKSWRARRRGRASEITAAADAAKTKGRQ